MVVAQYFNFFAGVKVNDRRVSVLVATVTASKAAVVVIIRPHRKNTFVWTLRRRGAGNVFYVGLRGGIKLRI